jgi:hypothetical protein
MPAKEELEIMAAPVVPTMEWQWPPDVLAFAAEHMLEPYLGPLLELARRVFPDARQLTVYVDQDPELRDVQSIVFDIQVVGWDLERLHAARKEWGREKFRIVPAPLICWFALLLDARRQ